MRTKFFLMACSIFLMMSCRSEYDKLVKSELASGIVNEDLFLGLKMGQSRMQFYSICWTLNSDKVISHGPDNKNVKYEIPKEDLLDEDRQVDILFFGIFDDDNIMRGLSMRFYYVAYADWNEELHADKLIHKVKAYLLDQFGGNDFIQIDLGINDIKSYVKVDGNRQIVVYPKDTKEVMVKIEDNRFKLNGEK